MNKDAHKVGADLSASRPHTGPAATPQPKGGTKCTAGRRISERPSRETPSSLPPCTDDPGSRRSYGATFGPFTRWSQGNRRMSQRASPRYEVVACGPAHRRWRYRRWYPRTPGLRLATTRAARQPQGATPSSTETTGLRQAARGGCAPPTDLYKMSCATAAHTNQVSLHSHEG